jgi:hypothetical protein
MDITEYSIIDENTVRLPKSICSYMRDNKEITLEILKMIEMLIQEKSTIKMNNELIIEIRNQNKTLTDYIKEMRTNYKSEIEHIQTQQKQTSEIINKIGPDIINTMCVKMYEINKDSERNMSLLLNENATKNINNLVDKLEKETENVILKTKTLINEIIPKQEQEYYKQYNNTIENFNKDINSKIDLYKNNSITLETLNIILNEKNKILTNEIQTNIEKYLTNMENDIRTTSDKTEKHNDTIEKELKKFLDQYKVSSKKGEFSEQILQSVLSSMFPQDEIINVTRDGEKKCDFELIRENKPSILIENKDYESINVPKYEVQKFVTNIIDNNKCGIMISQRNGIAGKSDYEIEFHNNLVLVYLHKVNYDSVKIQTAIDIIDNLHIKLTELYMSDTFTITNAQINKINEEYIEFIKQRNEVVNDINYVLTNTIDKIKKLEIISINTILCNNFSDIKLKNSKQNNTNYICKTCNKNFASSKALSNHIRSCKNKYTNNIIDVDTSPTSNDTPIHDTSPIHDTQPIHDTPPIDNVIITDKSTTKKNKTRSKLVTL